MQLMHTPDFLCLIEHAQALVDGFVLLAFGGLREAVAEGHLGYQSPRRGYPPLCCEACVNQRIVVLERSTDSEVGKCCPNHKLMHRRGVFRPSVHSLGIGRICSFLFLDDCCVLIKQNRADTRTHRTNFCQD